MVLLFLCHALLASGQWVNKIILGYLPVASFVALRMLVSGALLLGYVLYKNPQKIRWQIIKEDLVKLLTIPLLATYATSLLKGYGFQNMPATKASLIGSFDPFITALLAYFLLKENITIIKLLGLCVGFSGAAIAIITKTPSESLGCADNWWVFSYPELALVASTAIGRYGWMLAQKVLRAERYSSAELNGLLMVFGGMYSFGTALYIDGCYVTSAMFSWPLLGLLAYTILFGNIFGYTLFSAQLKKYSITLISLTGFSIPFFVQLLDWLLRGEPIMWQLGPALIIMLLGAFIFYSKELLQTTKKACL